MWGDLAIDSAMAGLLVAIWYLWFKWLNRRRSRRILQWIKCAFRGHGAVSQAHWHGASRFGVDLRLASSIFRRASLEVQLQPREMPLSWLLSRLRRHGETVTFEAELEFRPSLNFHVQNHRWCGRTRRIHPASWSKWHLENLSPVVLSTQPNWREELAQMVEALLASRACDFMHLAFRKKAPHFVACAPLQSLSPDAEGSAMFAVLQELASSVPASTC